MELSQRLALGDHRTFLFDHRLEVYIIEEWVPWGNHK